jgi:hypothetical protein
MWVAATNLRSVPDSATLHPDIQTNTPEGSYFRIGAARSVIARISIRAHRDALSAVQACDGRLPLSEISYPEGHSLLQQIRKHLHEALPDTKYPFAPTLQNTSLVLLCAKVGYCGSVLLGCSAFAS